MLTHGSGHCCVCLNYHLLWVWIGLDFVLSIHTYIHTHTSVPFQLGSPLDFFTFRWSWTTVGWAWFCSAQSRCTCTTAASAWAFTYPIWRLTEYVGCVCCTVVVHIAVFSSVSLVLLPLGPLPPILHAVIHTHTYVQVCFDRLDPDTSGFHFIRRIFGHGWIYGGLHTIPLIRVSQKCTFSVGNLS